MTKISQVETKKFDTNLAKLAKKLENISLYGLFYLKHFNFAAVGQQSRKPIDLPIERANYVQRNDENSWNFKKMALNRYKFEESNQKTEIGTDNEDSMDSCSSDLMSYHNYAKRRRPNIQIENHLR